MKTKLTSVLYLGYTSMDRRFSNAMLPWLLKEIKKMGINDKLSVTVEDGYLKAYNANFEPVIVHRLIDIVRASQVPGIPEELFYILMNEKDGLLNCYLFRANTAQEVTELFGQMREPSPIQGGRSRVAPPGGVAVTKNAGFLTNSSSEHVPWNTPSMSLPKNCHLNLTNENSTPFVRGGNGSSALSLCVDISLSDSHFFEVLYIGKVRISQRKVPDTLIDDALNKFAQHEAEKAKNNQSRRNSVISLHGASLSSVNSEEHLTEDKHKTESEPLQDSSNRRIAVSTTPLEPDKNIVWDKSPDEGTKCNNQQEIDQEFDQFTKDRLEKSSNVKKLRKLTPVPLEPNVLILNVPKNNLTTLEEDEEKQEDLRSILSNTASSITQFCQQNFLKDLSPEDTDTGVDEDECKVKNSSTNETAKDNDDAKDRNVKEPLRDPLFNIPITETKDYIHNKENIIIDKNVEAARDRSVREDSPLPNLNFDEITRKPKVLSRSKSGLDATEVRKCMMVENKPFLRDRSASIGTLNLKTPIAQVIGEQNRTMLFQVGRSELRLISPDRKQILLHRAFKDVASCVLGKDNHDHFGFVCRETTGSSESYACYVFKCESDSIATEVINAIKQAFIAHAELLKKNREKSPNLTCEHCPILWYHRLCSDIEGMNEKKAHAFILRRIEQLPEVEQDQIVTKYQVGTNHMFEVGEHNAFLMILLRAHCESKQQRHVHDTAENRSEFLNQYLGGSTIFMKAKRSLSSGFDHLLKRRSSRDEISSIPGLNLKKEPSPKPAQENSSESIPAVAAALNISRRKSLSPVITTTENNDASPPPLTPASAPVQETPTEEVETKETKQESGSNTPMIDIFLKLSDSRSSAEGATEANGELTWRQAIYRRHVELNDGSEDELSPKKLLGLQSVQQGKRTRDQLRQLWKMAIEQTILLVRMERENAKLKESEETSAMRRIKLEYNELGACDAGVTLMWDSLLARSASRQISKVDRHMLRQAVIQGVPRNSRGSVWYFLAEQATLRSPPPDIKKFPNYNTPYQTLLAGLTKHQHAILIDLGRTFPQHSYFASALGPGQLAMYNILKAYSLLDPDVGYCQGLSFVAGVLLLHLEEADAFVLLRHLMFRRGLRKQYLPDMSALQVQLYQLSRLIRDHEPELHAKLEALDVSPALYAAPWMLTLFTSQFPLAFVVRVFDLIFLESLDVVFAVSLALLTVHKDGLMMCESCEEAAEYLKHKMPGIDSDRGIYEKVMKKVHSLDISRQLADYAVEYSVLSEEVPRMTALMDANARLETDKLRANEELDSAIETINNYHNNQIRMEAQLRTMEQHLTTLSKYLSNHQKDLPMEIKKIIQLYNKKQGFGSKIFPSKFNDRDPNEEDQRKNLRTGTSTPNLFSKVTKEEIIEATKNNSLIETDKKSQFLMKKSQSVHSGLIANSVKAYPLKILEEKLENEDKQLVDLKKNSNLELIAQERLFEQKLKRDFDENLKRLDAKLSQKLMDEIDTAQNRRSMSLNITRCERTDSGFVTPLSPDSREKDDNVSVTSHPLSDCDVEIKFDGQSTKLKQIRRLSKQTDEIHSISSDELKITF